MKIPRTYYILLILGLLLLGWHEIFKPPKVDWRHSYSTFDAIPFGTEALYRLIPGIFPDQQINRINQTIYDYKKEAYSVHSIIYLNESVAFDQASRNTLLEHVHEGNQAFICAREIDEKLLDTLGIETFSVPGNFSRNPINLTLGNVSARLDTIRRLPMMQKMKALRIVNDSIYPKQVLGYGEEKPNYVHITFGQGAIFLHTEPLAFTNFYILKNQTYQYCEEAFKKMDVAPVTWSDYPNNGLRKTLTPLRYILNTNALKYAYYTLLITLILYLVLAGRRKQRPIPVITPPVNSSIDFIQTISNLYLQRKNHKVIAQHRINGLKKYVKDQWSLSWEPEEKDFEEKLSHKTGFDRDKTKKLLQLIRNTEENKTVSPETLFKLNQLIEQIKES